MGARLLAVLAGLDLGLGWVPADGVSPRLAAEVAAVALLVVVTGRPGGRWARPSRPAGHLDAASALALGTTILAGAPPDFGPDPARPAWLVVAVAAGVAMLGLSLPRPAGVPTGRPRLATSPVGPGRGGDQSRTRSYR
jgi:hypothetical protein